MTLEAEVLFLSSCVDTLSNKLKYLITAPSKSWVCHSHAKTNLLCPSSHYRLCLDGCCGNCSCQPMELLPHQPQTKILILMATFRPSCCATRALTYKLYVSLYPWSHLPHSPFWAAVPYPPCSFLTLQLNFCSLGVPCVSVWAGEVAVPERPRRASHLGDCVHF